MNTTKNSRRRNAYPGNCKVCGVAVAADAGWLYSDTTGSRSRSRRRVGGGWIKFVKCDRCHNLGVAHKSQLPENLPAPLPTLGVNAIRASKFQHDMVKLGNWVQPVVNLVLADGASEIIVSMDPIAWVPVGIGHRYEDGQPCFGGRVLTRAAAKELHALSLAAIDVYETFMYHPIVGE